MRCYKFGTIDLESQFLLYAMELCGRGHRRSELLLELPEFESKYKDMLLSIFEDIDDKVTIAVSTLTHTDEINSWFNEWEPNKKPFPPCRILDDDSFEIFVHLNGLNEIVFDDVKEAMVLSRIAYIINTTIDGKLDEFYIGCILARILEDTEFMNSIDTRIKEIVNRKIKKLNVIK